MSVEICLLGTQYPFKKSLSTMLVTLDLLQIVCEVFVCLAKRKLLYYVPTQLLILFCNVSIQFPISCRFEAVCADTSSNLGMMRVFLEIKNLLTANPWFVIDA